MSIEGQGHFFTIYFPGFVCFVLYLAKISGERLQDHWSSGLAHLSRRLKGELIVYQWSCRLSGCVSVNIFKLAYLHNQWANHNEILSELSLGWGKGCIRFWARSDRNSGVHSKG